MTPPVDTAFQVQDDSGTGGRPGRWHTAIVGAGVLCRSRVRYSDHVEIALGGETNRGTVRWDFGTDLIDCPQCLARLTALRATV